MTEWLHAIKRRLLKSPVMTRLLRVILNPYLSRQLSRLESIGSKSEDDYQSNPSVPPVVVILAFRHWAVHRAWETVLSKSLRQRGARVVWVTCDRLVSRCDSMLPGRREPGLCSHCVSFNRSAARRAGVEQVSLPSLLSEAEKRGEFDGLQSPQDAGLKAQAIASFQRLLGSIRLDLDRLESGDEVIWRELLDSARTVQRVADRLWDRTQPSAVIALNGKFFAEAILVDSARERGIPTWCYERGNIRNTIVVARDRPAIPFATESILESLGDEPLTQAESVRLRTYLNRRPEVGNGQVKFHLKRSTRTQSPAGDDRPIVALFTNLVWDSAVAGEDTIFENMIEWIIKTIEWTTPERTSPAAPRLVIRVHPAEERVYWHPTRTKVVEAVNAHFTGGLPEHVELVGPLDEVDSYALVEAAALVLVYASTVGLEAAVRGKPVIVSANSHYRAAPFVYAPDSVEEYRDYLEEWPCPRPSQVELAERYLYRLYFEHMIPVPGVDETPYGFRASNANAPAEALEEWLDEVIAATRTVEAGV